MLLNLKTCLRNELGGEHDDLAEKIFTEVIQPDNRMTKHNLDYSAHQIEIDMFRIEELEAELEVSRLMIRDLTVESIHV